MIASFLENPPIFVSVVLAHTLAGSRVEQPMLARTPSVSMKDCLQNSETERPSFSSYFTVPIR